MPIDRGGVGVLFLLLIVSEAILTDSLRKPFSAADISFSDMKDDDTKTPFSCTTVVHDKPANALPPSFPDSTTHLAPAIITSGTHHNPHRPTYPPSKVKPAIITRGTHHNPHRPTYPPSKINNHRKLLMDRKPSPRLPSCLPDC